MANCKKKVQCLISLKGLKPFRLLILKYYDIIILGKCFCVALKSLKAIIYLLIRHLMCYCFWKTLFDGANKCPPKIKFWAEWGEGLGGSYKDID